MEKKGFKEISANAQFTTHDTTIPKNAPLTNPLINVLDIMNLGRILNRTLLFTICNDVMMKEESVCFFSSLLCVYILDLRYE